MISHEHLLEALRYDETSGLFYWREKNSWRTPIGSIAGTPMKRGYWKITVRGASYYAHQLAWFYVYGVWPDRQIDHKDRDKINNRIGNLRVANQQGNSANMFRTNQNKSGYKGVRWHKAAKKWVARIKCSGTDFHLGLFENIEEANAAYCAKARELFGEFHAP
jgi:HNH endonuclease/AP2 domain